MDGEANKPRRPAVADHGGVFLCLPARLIAQVEAWAERTGRTRAAAFREIVVTGFSQFEKIEFPVQITKYETRRCKSAEARIAEQRREREPALF